MEYLTGKPSGRVPADMLANYAKESVFWRVSSDCLGTYVEIRISVEAAVTDTDYRPKRHRFHPWVAGSRYSPAIDQLRRSLRQDLATGGPVGGRT